MSMNEIQVRSTSSGEPDMKGRVFRDGAHGVLMVTGQSSRFIEEDGASFGLDADSGWLTTLTCRPATADEAAPFLKAEAEELAAQRVATQLRADKASLFVPAEGEYLRAEEQIQLGGVEIPWGDGRTLYGGGEWFVVVDTGPWAGVWHVLNNGADGDDWSRNNVWTGGAGAIGRRYEATPARRAFLRALPGGDKIGMTEAQRRRSTVLRAHAESLAVPSWMLDAEADGHAPEGLELARKQAAELAAFLGGAEPIDVVPPAPRVWTQIGGRDVGMSLDGTELVVRVRGDGSGRVALAYQPTPAMVATVRGRWPAWVGTAAPGRYVVGRIVADNGADALRAAAFDYVPVEEVQVAPGVTIAHLTHGTVEPFVRGLVLWSDGAVTRLGGSVSLWSGARSRTVLRASIARRDAAGETVYPHERERAAGRDAWAGPGFPAHPEPPPETTRITSAAAELVHLALASKAWHKDRRYKLLLDVVSEQREQVLRHEDQHPRSGEDRTLFRVTATHADGRTSVLWLVKTDWWNMGEDGDAGTDFELHQDEAAARAACQPG